MRNYGRTADSSYTREYGNQCVYCGGAAQVLDHAYPASREPELAPEGMLLLVPACTECNSILGDEMHETMRDRREYVRRRLKTKYHKVLNSPAWTEEEILELRGKLKAKVRRMEKEKKMLYLRMHYEG